MASAVRVMPPDADTDRVEPTGTTADKMCQSPKRESWVTTVLVDEVMSDGDEDSTSFFLQPKRVKSADIQRDKILKHLQINRWGNTNDADLAAGLGLVAKVSLVYVFEALIMTFYCFLRQKYNFYLKTTKFILIFLKAKYEKFRDKMG